MAKTCAQCNREYKGDTCPTCTETGVDIGKVLESEKEQMEKNESAVPTAFLVDLVSNRKIPITTPRCRVGRDDLNDIVISGDQSISRFHFIITYEDSQYYVQDAKSRHGTFLNGNQISGPEAINDGDVLKIGVSLFWFVIETAQGGSEESLQPVDVEKIASEELSLKKGSNLAAMSEAELTATMEIDLPTAGALAAAEAKVMEAAEAAKSNREEEESKVEKAEPADSKKEDSEPESKSDAKSESKSDEDEDEEEEPAKAADKDDEEAEPESEKKDDAPAEDEAKSAKVTSESDIEMTVKDLLEPLQDELEASRAMIKDALKKGNLRDEEPAESKSEEDAPESKDEDEDDSKDEEKSEDSDEPEEKPESKDDDDEKGAEPVSEDEPEEKKESEDKESEESKSDSLSVAGLDVEPADVPVSGLDDEDEDEDEEPESKDDEDEEAESEKDEPEPESKDEEPESKEEETDEKAEPTDKSEDDAESDSSTKDKTSKGKSAEAETLEKIAEIIDDSSSKQEAEPEPEASREDADSQKEDDSSRDDDGKTTHAEPATMETANGAEEEITIMGPTSVPDWCKKYFSDELKHLTKELDSLNEQIKQTQERMRKIEAKAALTKGLRNTLLTADGDDLIEACVKVLGLTGWKVTQSEDDKNELVLEHGDEQVAIARIIWTKDKAERSHLGQLSISQTRYWCENGVEPKGILILSKLSDKAPTDRSNEADADLVTYAQQKNVCLMDTVQLLALYRDIALKDAKTDERREKIQDGKGWLSGFELEPGDEADDSEEKEATKGKSLSSLLSA